MIIKEMQDCIMKAWGQGTKRGQNKKWKTTKGDANKMVACLQDGQIVINRT